MNISLFQITNLAVSEQRGFHLRDRVKLPPSPPPLMSNRVSSDMDESAQGFEFFKWEQNRVKILEIDFYIKLFHL